MFTGIVEEVGRIREATPSGDAVRFRVGADRVREDLALGDSVAVDGVCQTIVELDDDGFAIEAIGTTLSRTTLGGMRAGRRVNLERALAFGARVGGHLVQGHVDGVGEVAARERAGEHVLLDVRLPDIVAPVTILHGSITIDGVSLTVNARPAPDVAQVALIPYTWEHTSLSDREVGDTVNVEGDMIGKFVVHNLERTQSSEGGAEWTGWHGRTEE